MVPKKALVVGYYEPFGSWVNSVVALSQKSAGKILLIWTLQQKTVLKRWECVRLPNWYSVSFLLYMTMNVTS